MMLYTTHTRRYLAFALAAAVSFLLVGVSVVYGQETAARFNEGIQEVLWNLVANVFGWIVGIAGVVMNYAITQYIVEFGTLFAGDASAGSGTGVGAAVEQVWAGVRDIFNLTFIFALVYLGFKMILNSDDAGTRKWLANIIIAALLVNFSLFITKFIVDVSNILAVEVYQAFPTDGEDGISGAFMNIFGVTSVWDWSSTDLQGNAGYMYIFGSAIIFLVTAFAFFSAGILIMIRFIALNLYMALSPIMFLGMVLPQFKSVSSKYWSGFLGRAFYAPVFLLMLYFSFMILSALPGNRDGLAAALNGSNSQAGAGAPDIAIETSIVSFMLGIGFLLASVQVASKMSADGAGAVMKIGNNITNRAKRGLQNGARNTGRFAARNTAGYVAMGVGAGAEGARRRLDRGLGNMAQGGAVSRFTARTLDRTVGAGLRSAEGASIAGSETVAQNRKRVEEQQNRFNATAKETKRAKDYQEQRAEIDRQQALLDDTATTGIDRQRAETLKANAEAALGAVIKEMSVDELRGLGEVSGGFWKDESSGAPRSNAEILADETVSKHLTTEQMKALGSSGGFTNEQMKAIGKSRTSGIYNEIEEALKDTSATADELTENFDKLSETVQKMTDEETVKLGIDNLSKTTIAANLTQRQLDAISKSGKFTQSEIAQIKTARETGLNQIATDGSLHIERTDPITGSSIIGAVQPALDPSKSTSLAEQKREFYTNQRNKLFEKKAGQTDPLPISIFTDTNMVEYLTPRALEQRIKDGYISDADMATIKANVENYATTPRTAGSPEEIRRQAAHRVWKKWSESRNNVIAAQANFNIP